MVSLLSQTAIETNDENTPEKQSKKSYCTGQKASAVRFLLIICLFLSFKSIANLLGNTGKLRNPQGFAPDVFWQSGGGDAVRNLRLAEATEAGGKTVDQRLAPLGEAGVNYLKEQLFVRNGAGGRGAAAEGDHRRGDLGLRDEAGGGHVKQNFRLGIVLAEQGEGAVVLAAGLGADALGDLLLHHDRYRLKAP